MNRVPTQTPSAPRASAAARPAPVEDAPGRDYWHLFADRIDHLGNERHRGHLTGVPSSLRALGHDDVAPGVHCAPGMVDLAAHVDDEQAAAMAELHHLAGHTQPGHEDRGASLDDVLDLTDEVAGHGGEQVHPEWVVGGPFHLGDLGHHTLPAHGGRPETSEAAGFRDRSDERGVGHAAHAGQHHRVLYPEDLGQSSLHGLSPIQGGER